MKLITFLCALLGSAVVMAEEKNPELELRSIAELAGSRKHTEAVVQLQEFAQRAEVNPRTWEQPFLERALPLWQRLAENEESALLALEELSAELEDKLLGEGARSRTFRRMALVHRALGQSRRTALIFQELINTNPELAHSLRSQAQPFLDAERALQYQKAHSESPMAVLEMMIEEHTQRHEMVESRKRLQTPRIRAIRDQFFVKQASRLIYAVEQSGHQETAEALRARARQVVDAPEFHPVEP
ncbi:MAG: hypothetical protein ACFCU3_05865 [Verrucomicrobiales bacterium]